MRPSFRHESEIEVVELKCSNRESKSRRFHVIPGDQSAIITRLIRVPCQLFLMAPRQFDQISIQKYQETIRSEQISNEINLIRGTVQKFDQTFFRVYATLQCTNYTSITLIMICIVNQLRTIQISP